MQPDVFEYSDYRLYLNEAYQSRKAEWKHFSHRYIAQKGGFSSGFFARVLKGTTNISQSKAEAIADIFGIYHLRREYFLNLVEYAQARSTEEREKYYAEMNEIRTHFRKVLSKDQYAYYAQWYHAVIRELAAILPGSQDPQVIQDHLRNTVEYAKIEQSLQLLQDLELIRPEAKGKGFTRQDRVISTGDETQLEAVAEFASSSLDLARWALHTVERPERSVSSVVLSVSDEGKEKIRAKLDQVRREILDIAADDRNVNQVIQVNLQMIPHTK